MFQGHNSKEMSQSWGGVHVAIHITSSQVELMFPASCPKVTVTVSNEVKPHLTTVFSPPCFPPSNQPLDLHLYALGCHRIKQPTPTPPLKNNQFFCVFFSTLIHAKTQMKHTQKTHETKHTNKLLSTTTKKVLTMIPPNPLWEYELSVTD